MVGNEDVYRKSMSQGHSAAWDQLWEHAAGFYRQALEEQPDDPSALISLGMALTELAELNVALDVYRRATEVTPTDPIPMEKVAQLSEKVGLISDACEAAIKAADLYLKKGDPEKAIENWSLVTRLDPDHIIAHSRLALSHEKLGRKNQSVTEYLALASLLQHSGKKEEALQVVNHALQMTPSNDNVRQTLMLIHTDQPLPKPARPALVTTPFELPSTPLLEEPSLDVEVDRELDPIMEARKNALAELAETLFELSEEEEETPEPSRRGLQEIMKDSGKARSEAEHINLIYRLRQAIDLQTQEQNEEAIDELEDVLELGLEFPAIFFSLGYLSFQTGRLESSMRHLQRAVNHSEYALGSRLLLGGIWKQRGRSRDAALEYLEALKLADSMVIAPEQTKALQQMYDPLIEAHFHSALDEEHEQLCANIVELLIQEDWRNHLETARRELPISDPDAPPVPIAEILTQARSGQIVGALSSIHQEARNGHFRVAMDEAFRALDYAPTYLPLHTLMGDLLIKQERVDEGIEKYAVVAKAYSARGEALRARDLFKRILQLAPMDLESRKRLIEQLIASGDIDAALIEYLELAEVYLRLAELATARETFSHGLRLAQQSNVGRGWSVKILHHMADIDMQRMDWRQALRMYDQIRKLEPGDDTARSNLIQLNLRMGQEDQAIGELDNYLAYLHREGRLEQGLKDVEDLVVVYPKNTILLQRLAELYSQLGQSTEAVKVWDQVGETFLKDGDQVGAIKALQSIITLNPPNVEDYERLLKDLTSV
jgi:tetratricopeptide (TPR) repeat protein